MNAIKFINKSTIKLNNITYKGYPIGELPKRFAFITEWFNYKGLTYVEHTPSFWSYV